MLSKKAHYALKAALFLARRHGSAPTSAAELAIQERIPRKFLEVILLELKNRGILRSQKGRVGGFLLSRAPSEINVGEIVRGLDGTIALLHCVSRTEYRPCAECADVRTCSIRLLFKEVRDATSQLLDGESLADLIERGDAARQQEDGLVMYHI
jgi:Rrf2 family protein